MVEPDSILSVAAAQRQLLEAFAVLEQAGEFAAAAHVAAALDSLDLHPAADGHCAADGAVAMLAGRMRDAFGDAAEAVARRQLGEARGAAMLAWAAVLDRMDANARPDG